MEENIWLKPYLLRDMECRNSGYIGVPLKDWEDILTLAADEFASRGVGFTYKILRPTEPKPGSGVESDKQNKPKLGSGVEADKKNKEFTEALNLWNSVADEFYKLLCTKDKKYSKLRKKINSSADEGSKVVIGAIAAAFASEIGVVGGAIMGFCSALVYAAVRLGIEGYCVIASNK